MRGFTLIEIVIVVAIMAIIVSISFRTLVSFNNAQALDKDTKGILSLLDEARSNTLQSQDASQYGVHFEAETVVEFKGATYSPSALTNKSAILSGQTLVSQIAFQGGGSDIVFTRLTGEPNATGTVKIEVKQNSALQKIITIYGTGISEEK